MRENLKILKDEQANIQIITGKKEDRTSLIFKDDHANFHQTFHKDIFHERLKKKSKFIKERSRLTSMQMVVK